LRRRRADIGQQQRRGWGAKKSAAAAALEDGLGWRRENIMLLI
jgi:hypothetical protein